MSNKAQIEEATQNRAGESRFGGAAGASPIKTAIWGCGAVSEYYYAPALKTLSDTFDVVALFDPSVERLECLGRLFPSAAVVSSFAELPAETQLVIICSPPRFHVEQSLQALERGVHILCEKPVATTRAEVEKIVQASAGSSRMAAAGLFRRFYPSSVAVKQLLDIKALGELESFDFQEGERFQWQSRSSALFERSTAGGGVLADIGSHVLDLLTWWLGPTHLKAYFDDYMGGVEANCLVQIETSGGVSGSVRLSRDCRLANRYSLRCSSGTITWIVGEANGLELTLPNGQLLSGELLKSYEPLSGMKLVDSDYFQSFKNQLVNVARSIAQLETLRIPVSSVVPGVELMERCYANRQLIPMGWLNARESAMANKLNQQQRQL